MKDLNQITLSKDHAIQVARQFTLSTYNPHELNVRYERLGMLIDFIHALVDQTNENNRNATRSQD